MRLGLPTLIIFSMVPPEPSGPDIKVTPAHSVQSSLTLAMRASAGIAQFLPSHLSWFAIKFAQFLPGVHILVLYHRGISQLQGQPWLRGAVAPWDWTVLPVSFVTVCKAILPGVHILVTMVL